MSEGTQLMLVPVVSVLLIIVCCFAKGEYDLRYEKEPCVCAADGGAEE